MGFRLVESKFVSRGADDEKSSARIKYDSRGLHGRPRGELDWMFPQFREGYMRSTAEALGEIDTFLMGRVAYEGVAPYWPNATDEIAPIMNEAVK